MAKGSELPEFGDRNDRAERFEALYREYAPGLRRRCQRLTHDPAAADDLMQEVFARFIARFPDPPADMNVGGYLHAAAGNILWKQLRDEHEVVDEHIVVTAGMDDQLERDPERAALLVEQRGLVQRCAALLTGRQRRALALREVDGRSYAEIGSELGIGEQAVGQVITRARARLRGALRRAQIDFDQLPAECRAMLSPLSDYVDGHLSESTDEFERHMAECDACRATLAAYQEAGSRLRGAAPLAPLAGLLVRFGDAFRGGEGTLGVAGIASVATAAILTVGGGGVVVAHTLAHSHAHTAPRPAAATHAGALTRRATLDVHTAFAAPAVARAIGASTVARQHAHRSAPVHGASRTKLGSAGQLRLTSRHPGGTKPGPAVTPAASTTTAPPGSAEPPRRTTSTPVTTPATTPVVTSPTIPTVTTKPVATVPAITKVVPVITPAPVSVTTPAVSVPAVTTPSITTPAVSTPAITVPQVTTPAITTPIATVPPVTTPAVSVPSVTVPPVTVPGISTPPVVIPPVKVHLP